MRLRTPALGTALALAGLLAASAAAAQTAPVEGIALPVHGLRPADVVARLAREALAAPTDSSTWAELAGALPEMALTQGADLEGTFEAARLADSLSAATTVSPAVSAPPDPAPAASADEPGSVILRSAAGMAAVLPPWAPGAALLAATSLLFALVVHRRRRAAARRPAPAAARPSAQSGRAWTTATLASGGLAVPEIARRTGRAQEAVGLELRLRARKDGTGNESATQQWRPAPNRRPAGPQGAVPTSEGLRREVMAGAGRMRDGRLTYGGVAR